MAFACATALSACGGSGGNLILSGAVSGLAKDGLVLSNGSSTVAVANGATSFAFTDLIGNNTNYNVAVQTQPTGAVCSVTGGAGQSSNYNVTTVLVTCVTDQYTLGGSATGPGAAGLILLNGKDSVRPIPDSTAGTYKFTFSGTVGDGSPYGVTILPSSNPANNCVVSNGVGTMVKPGVSNVAVSCS
ncbi:MAG TPA: hypothetical protein DCW29_05965 [Janthinobacterium sp.]|nr:hypothetical protein [Janthinobacterium sp.]